jgi:heme-degrading monooxygenase HmoA
MAPERALGTSHDGPVTLINVFEVPVGQVEDSIKQWHVRARLMAAAPGVRDARLHRAASPQARFQLVNVAHWESRQALDQALSGEAFQDMVRTLRKESGFQFSASPAVYEIVAELGER